MLTHEWMRNRGKHAKRDTSASAAPEDAAQDQGVEEEALAEDELIAEETPEATEESAHTVPESAQTPAEMPETEHPATSSLTPPSPDADTTPDSPTSAPKEPGAAATPSERPRNAFPGPETTEVDEVAPEDFQGRRLQALLGRQQRLPLELQPAEQNPSGSKEASETREELIERLLDPVLSIGETATLLGVCPTSVRRYTNRGVLKCFRTPGNQRRFRLSDVLDFMEQQQEA
jgi:excisionase family DNA binding protein